jgi:hypothetical protein
MDVVTIKGVEYQRISTLAKKFKYTTDYIGQLCRGKKIDAQLVGRSWYVNPLSLESHKKSRYVKSEELPASEETLKKPLSKDKSRISVQPVITKGVTKTISSKANNFSKRIDWKPVKYEYDESDLLPALNTTNKHASIKVDLADATEIPIKNTTNSTTLVSDPLPEVSMSGSLKVDSLNDPFPVDTDDDKLGSFKSTDKVSKLEPTVSSKKTQPFKDRLLSKEVLLKTPLTPKSIDNTKKNTSTKEPFNISKIVFFSLLAISVILLISLFALVTVDSEQVADTLLYDSSLKFSLREISEFFTTFLSKLINI